MDSDWITNGQPAPWPSDDSGFSSGNPFGVSHVLTSMYPSMINRYVYICIYVYNIYIISYLYVYSERERERICLNTSGLDKHAPKTAIQHQSLPRNTNHGSFAICALFPQSSLCCAQTCVHVNTNQIIKFKNCWSRDAVYVNIYI